MAEQRDNLLDGIVTNVADYITLMTGDDLNSVSMFIKNKIKQDIQIPDIENVIRKNGDLIAEKSNLLKFINSTAKNFDIMTPSGSVYVKPSVHLGLIPKFEGGLITGRDESKALMYQAKVKGDVVLAENYNYDQSNKKISANSISGIMKSPGNLFYDVGNYNAITSVARTTVTMAFLINEQCISGNFAFFRPDELINHIILCRRNMPSVDDIYKCVDDYRLQIPSHTDLTTFLFNCIVKYYFELPKNELYTYINNIVCKLTEVEVIYVYYYNNLKHLFMDNEHFFKPFIKNMMDVSNLGKTSTDPSDLKATDHDLLNVITTCYNELLDGKSIKDVIKDDPDTAMFLADVASFKSDRIGELDLLFNTFIFNSFIPPKMNHKKDMLRNSVLLLDTDSNIFTVINWVRWFTGNEFSDDIENYQIAVLIIYFICKIVAKDLYKLAYSLGVEKDDRPKLIMKNEFFYPVFLILSIKKNYVGLKTIQEGLKLKKAELDLKGQVLGGSSICKTSQVWFKDFIETFLTTCMGQQVDGYELIMHIVNFENRIKQSLMDGDITFIKHASIREKDYYKNVEGSVYMYAEAWNTLYTSDHERIVVPTKVGIVKIITPSQSYLNNLKQTNITLYDNFIRYKETYGRWMTSIALHPLTSAIPKELIPLINIRHIIHHNVSPAYVILDSIGIGLQYDDKKNLLLSDIYVG